MLKLGLAFGLLWTAAEGPEVAALEQAYARAQGHDKLAVTLDLLEATSDTSPRKAADYYAQSLDLLQAFPNDRLSADIHSEGCWAHYAIGETGLALSICQQGLQHQATFDEPELRAEFLNLLALVYETDGDRTRAFDSMNRALELSNEPRMRGVIHSNAGLMLESQGAYEQALVRYKQAVEEGQTPGISDSDKHYVSATAFLRMGEMNRKLGDFDSAIQYQELALESGRLTNYVPDQIESLVFLSKIYLDTDELALAQQRSEQAVKVALTVEQRDMHALAKANRALVLLRSGKLGQALELSRDALSDAQTVGTLEAISNPTMTLARVLFAAGEYESALAEIARIETTMRERDQKGELEEVLKLRSEILAAQGHPELAYAALREFNQISGANLEARARQRLSLMQVQLDIDARRQEVLEALQNQKLAELQSRRDRLIRNGSVGALIAGLLIIALFMSRHAQRKIAAREREIQRQLKSEVDSRTSQLRKEIETRQKLEADLLQSQKLDALGQLTGGIAHDFNNLMTVVIGATELVLESRDTKLSERDRESLEGAVAAAESGSDITRQLLSFSRHQHLVPNSLNMGKKLSDMRPILQRTLGASISLTIDVPSEDHCCAVDDAQLTTAILNLALNARDAIEGAGALTIRLKGRATPSGEHDVQAGNYCQIDVQDSGSGMPDEVRQRALEPFFTTKDHASGTGLGLSMIYGFVRQSNGKVTIRSEPGQGTTVSLWLPTISEATKAETAHQPQRSDTPIEASSHRILVVEDQPAVRQLASDMLRGMGHAVVTACDGDEAREVLMANSHFDAVISDIVMPGKLDGRSLARWVSDHFPHIKTLLTSGYHEYQGDQLGYPLLGKPYSLRTLSSALDELFSNAPGTVPTTDQPVLS